MSNEHLDMSGNPADFPLRRTIRESDVDTNYQPTDFMIEAAMRRANEIRRQLEDVELEIWRLRQLRERQFSNDTIASQQAHIDYKAKERGE